MQVDLNKLKIYYLTLPNKARIKNLKYNFASENLVEVNPVVGIHRFKSGATGFMRIVSDAIKKNERFPFDFFCMLEDDVSKVHDFNPLIRIPEDCDLLYIGISEYGYNPTKRCGEKKVYYSEVDGFDHLVRVYNMLSMHGIVVCSPYGALLVYKSMLCAYYEGVVWDIKMAINLKNCNAYALKQPIVYQDASVGGIEKHTKINFPLCNAYYDGVVNSTGEIIDDLK